MHPIAWKTTLRGTGTEFQTGPHASGSTLNRRVIVKRIRWTRPGAFRKTIEMIGWAVFVDGTQMGLAHTTAKKARAWAEQPGVWAEIQELLR